MRKLVWVTGLCNRDNPLCRRLLFLKSALQSLLVLWELASQCHSRFILPESLLVGRLQGEFPFGHRLKVLCPWYPGVLFSRWEGEKERTYEHTFVYFLSFLPSTPSFSDWLIKAGLSHSLPQSRGSVTPVHYYYVIGVECGFWECVTGVSCHSNRTGVIQEAGQQTSSFKSLLCLPL